MKLQTFDQFVLETLNTQELNKMMSRNVHIEILEAISMSNVFDTPGKDYIKFIINENLVDEFFYISLNESSKLQDWFQNKVDIAKQHIKDGVKEVKDQLVAKIGSFVGLAKMIGTAVANVMKKIWDWLVQNATEAINKIQNDLEEMVKDIMKDEANKETFFDELKNSTKMFGHAAKFVTKEIPAKISNAVSKSGSETVETSTTDNQKETVASESINYSLNEIIQQSCYVAIIELIKENEDFVNEILNSNYKYNLNEEAKIKIPGLSLISDKIKDLPPFSIYKKIEDTAVDYSTEALERLSYLITKFANGPGPFKFKNLGKLFGKAIGKNITGNLEDMLDKIKATIAEKLICLALPGIGSFMVLLKKVATGWSLLKKIESTVNNIGKAAAFAKAEKAKDKNKIV